MQEFLLVEADERAPQRLRRKALELTDTLISALEGIATDDAKAIHDARRRLKELRALTAILGRKAERKFFRDAGRELSAARDAKAAVQAFDRLRERFASEWKPRQYLKIRRGLKNRIGAGVDNTIIANLRGALTVERGKIAAWPADEMRREELWDALARSYRRSRRGMRRASEERTPETIHEWRKRVKMHWYHAQFLTMVNLAHLESRIDSLRSLSRTLGDHHDLVLIDEICRSSPELLGSRRYVRKFRTYIARALAELLAEADRIGEELFRQPTREWIAGVRESLDGERTRIGPKKTPPRVQTPPAMLA